MYVQLGKKRGRRTDGSAGDVVLSFCADFFRQDGEVEKEETAALKESAGQTLGAAQKAGFNRKKLQESTRESARSHTHSLSLLTFFSVSNTTDLPVFFASLSLFTSFAVSLSLSLSKYSASRILGSVCVPIRNTRVCIGSTAGVYTCLSRHLVSKLPWGSGGTSVPGPAEIAGHSQSKLL